MGVAATSAVAALVEELAGIFGHDQVSTHWRVNWLCGDVRTFAFGNRRFDVWHDRAVFHFLTDATDRVAYVRQVARAVSAGGHVIVATFGPEGPTQRSGLDVVRYDPEALHDEFGAAFRLVQHCTELHHTPTGRIQQFSYCHCNVASSELLSATSQTTRCG